MKPKKKPSLRPWHEAVCEAANYTCFKCGKCFNYPCYFDENDVNQYVCGHHEKTQKAHPDKRLDVSNGKCVCLECHNEIHNGEKQTEQKHLNNS